MPTTTLTSKGQITLPKKVRDHLRLSAGDRLEFLIQPDGTVRVRPAAGSARALFGLLHRSGAGAPTLGEIREGMIAYLAEEDERIRKGRR
jgi:AbrB family looped-hinge helix DNA binding protein